MSDDTVSAFEYSKTRIYEIKQNAANKQLTLRA